MAAMFRFPLLVAVGLGCVKGVVLVVAVLTKRFINVVGGGPKGINWLEEYAAFALALAEMGAGLAVPISMGASLEPWPI
jgi:hypothetical protein